MMAVSAIGEKWHWRDNPEAKSIIYAPIFSPWSRNISKLPNIQLIDFSATLISYTVLPISSYHSCFHSDRIVFRLLLRE